MSVRGVGPQLPGDGRGLLPGDSVETPAGGGPFKTARCPSAVICMFSREPGRGPRGAGDSPARAEGAFQLWREIQLARGARPRGGQRVTGAAEAVSAAWEGAGPNLQ